MKSAHRRAGLRLLGLCSAAVSLGSPVFGALKQDCSFTCSATSAASASAFPVAAFGQPLRVTNNTSNNDGDSAEDNIAATGLFRQGFPVTVSGSTSSDYVSQLPIYYSNEDEFLAAGDAALTSAFIVLADDMTTTRAAFCSLLQSSAFQETLGAGSGLVELQFLTSAQNVDDQQCRSPQNSSNWLTWSSESDWVNGALSLPTGAKSVQLSSYSVVDSLLIFLKDKTRFPQLTQITLTGFGHGADVRPFLAIVSVPCCWTHTGG